jgi:branched-subunit amino acid ABC-type transport system permease component
MFELLPQLIANSLITGSIYALASAGLALTFGILRILNFAHGHTMMVGAYVYFLFVVTLGFGMLAASIMTILVMLVLGIISLNIFIKPFAASSLLPFVTTVALGAILEAIIGMTFGVNVQSFSSSFASDSINLSGVFVTWLEILIVGSAILILGIMALVVHRTSLGRRIRAIAENPSAAEALGISRKKITLGAFLFSAILAAYAGILVGYETNLQPMMGNAYSIKAFAAMILGGLGNVWGTVIGAYLLGFVENLSVGLDFWGYSVPSGYKDAFSFVIILFVLLVRPQGLFGTKGRSA